MRQLGNSTNPTLLPPTPSCFPRARAEPLSPSLDRRGKTATRRSKTNPSSPLSLSIRETIEKSSILDDDADDGAEAPSRFLSVIRRYERDRKGWEYEELPSDLWEAPVALPLPDVENDGNDVFGAADDFGEEEWDSEESNGREVREVGLGQVDAGGEAVEIRRRKRGRKRVRSDELDLSRWTLVVTDTCLGRIAERNAARRAEAEAWARWKEETNEIKDERTARCSREDASGWSRRDEVNAFSTCPRPCQSSSSLSSPKAPKQPLRGLNLSGASLITDAGLTILSQSLGPDVRALGLVNAFKVTAGGLRILVQNCPNLRSLDLSGCLAVSENGFAIIGQHVLNLRRLRLSGCRKISPWALGKVFSGCTELREVDVSFCAQLTDRELQALARGCGQSLRVLNLRGCSQISDVGIQLLSKGCPNITKVDLGRSDLIFKITDVSLMSLSEGCCKLASVTLKGCEMISDVGLSWLARGCGAALRHIDLTRCCKITNGGIRYLGEDCPHLRSVILTNLKKVSDIGLRYLADGCHYLEELVIPGLCLLGDGFNRDFGLGGLQALGRSECVPHMKILNLNGCFQVSRIGLQSIASFKALTSLTLSGCKKLSPEGLKVVAASCHELRQLIMAGCGKAVSDESAKLLVGSMPHLEKVDFRGCPYVGRGTMAALGSACSNLRQLNVSGCSLGMTDDAVLALCSSGRYDPPGLESLDISKCELITDVSLTFIADHLQTEHGLDITLAKLCLLGTKVTLSAVRAFQDRFYYSIVKKNSSYFGLWPLPRSDDRRYMAEHRRRAQSATLIQAAFRSMRDRKIAAQFRGRYCRTKVATKLAARFRGRRARTEARRMRYEVRKKHEMAIRLQCFFRLWAAKRRETWLRRQRWLVVAPFAVTVVQRRYRGVLGRRVFRTVKLEHEAMIERYEQAAIKLQSACRKMLAVILLWGFQRRKAETEAQREYCSLKLQTRWRIRKAREVLHYRKFGRLASAVRREQERNRAAKVICTCWRKHDFRKKITDRVMRTRCTLACTKSIQKWYRQRCQAFAERATKMEIRSRERDSASITIQCAVRRRAANLVLEHLKRRSFELEVLRCKKAFVLSNWWRLCLARHRVGILRTEREEELRKLAKLHTWSATQIAAGWRGKRGRDKAKRAYRTKQQRWKQLWSNEESRPFYYNQITGETRWRKPQALLDLEPRPVCSNCSFYDAQVECSDCSEYFCKQCWDAVHFGGRRSAHIFRSLYDYYGRRVDYGDGEFPSVWPTEIEQNDLGHLHACDHQPLEHILEDYENGD